MCAALWPRPLSLFSLFILSLCCLPASSTLPPQEAINVDATFALGRAAAAAGAVFVHISTDYVFEGTQARLLRKSVHALHCSTQRKWLLSFCAPPDGTIVMNAGEPQNPNPEPQAPYAEDASPLAARPLNAYGQQVFFILLRRSLSVFLA